MILLTRPQSESEALAVIFGEENCVIAPMMKIEQTEFALPKNAQAIVSTSKNVGFDTDIKIPTEGKTAQEVLQYCINNLRPKNGKVIYLSGDDVTLDIAKELKAKGYDAERVVAYKQIPTTEAALKLDEITIATFFSLNSLKNFAEQYSDHDLRHIKCICISSKLAKTAKKMGWEEVVIAGEPNLAGMMDAVSESAY